MYFKALKEIWKSLDKNLSRCSSNKKPAEVRQGKGKGAVEFWAARVKPGKVLFEIDGVSKKLSRRSIYVSLCKIPNKNKFVIRIGA